MKSYYELHITYLGELVMFRGWTGSVIDGDPVLGAGPKRYLTRHEPATAPQEVMIKEMEDIAAVIATMMGRKVLRTKIELVVYDNKRA